MKVVIRFIPTLFLLINITGCIQISDDQSLPSVPSLVNNISTPAVTSAVQFHLPTPSMPMITTNEPTISSAENFFGQIYFVVDNLGDFKLVHIPADCLLRSAPCPEPQEITGYYPGSTIAPLLWSPNYSKAAVISSENERRYEIKIFDPQENLWQSFGPVEGSMNGLAWSPNGSEIAFVTSQASNSQISLFTLKDYRIQNLVGNLPGNYIGLVWLDNSHIITAGEIEGNSEILLLDVESRSWINLTESPFQDKYPALSPDHNRIAFVSNQSGQDSLFLMNSDGTDLNTIHIPQNGSVQEPIWSPDGRKLAFTLRSEDHLQPPEIYIVHPDGTGLRNLSSNSGWGPVWSPDSKHLIYQANDVGFTHLYLASLENETVKRLHAVGLSEDQEWIEPSWQFK